MNSRLHVVDVLYLTLGLVGNCNLIIESLKSLTLTITIMSSIVRDSIEKYRKVLDKTTEIRIELDRTFRAYLLAAYDIISQTGGYITFLNP